MERKVRRHQINESVPIQDEGDSPNFRNRLDSFIEENGEDWQEKLCIEMNSGDILCGRVVHDPEKNVNFGVTRVSNGSSFHTVRSISIFVNENNANHMVAEVMSLGEKNDPRFEIHDYGRFLTCDFDFFEHGATGIFDGKGIANPEANIQSLFNYIESICATHELEKDTTDMPPLAAG